MANIKGATAIRQSGDTVTLQFVTVSAAVAFFNSTTVSAGFEDEPTCDDCGSSPQGYSGGTPYCGLCHKSHFSHPKKG